MSFFFKKIDGRCCTYIYIYLCLFLFFCRNEKEYENFSSTLTSNLRQQIKHMKMMKQFLTSCPSESVVNEKTVEDAMVVPGGLGLMFEFPGDSKKLKDKSKMKLWKKYFDGKKSKSIRIFM